MKSLIQDIIGREQKVISYSSPDDTLVRRLLINSIELSTGRGRIEKAYKKLSQLDIHDVSIWDHVFPLLEIELKFNREKLSSIPQNVPVVIIANHPYGVADGMALGYVLSKLRNNFRLVVNEVLCREQVLGKYFLPIDFRDTKSAMMTNIETRRTSMSFLAEGGALGIFPSGGVSTTPKIWHRTAQDLEWKKFVIKLVRQKNVYVVPIFFKGQNSASFQIASHIHPNIRLALLLNELRRKRKRSLEFVIGDVLGPDTIQNVSRSELLSFLKSKTFELKSTCL